MQIIPVIDIKSGVAVLARQGDRQSYRPLSTPLCHSCELEAVLNAYLSLYPFTQVYIADLDALMANGNNFSRINKLVKHHPQINFMIDGEPPNGVYAKSNITPVMGTESLNEHTLKATKQQNHDFILSLDFCAQDKLMGPIALYESPHLWPKQLIIMSLALVGKNSGPDLTKLQYYYNTYPQHQFIAAGGIRNKQDLMQIKAIGIQQALVASSLHNRTLTKLDIEQLLS